MHYKILEASFDCSNLPELTQEHTFIGFPGGDTRIPATSREETEAALLDLIEAEALDVFDDDARLTRGQAIAVALDDSSWSYEAHGGQVEVVNNDKTAQLVRDRPDENNPHLSFDRTA